MKLTKFNSINRISQANSNHLTLTSAPPRALSTGAPTICAEPVRLADKPWEKVESQEFACKPTVVVAEPVVQVVSTS